MMKEQMGELRSETDHKLSKMSDEIAEEKKHRADEYKRLDEKVKNTATGDLWLSETGALWLLVGVALSSTSVELAKWLN